MQNKANSTNAEIINEVSVKSSDFLTSGGINADTSGNVKFIAYDGIDYNYQYITMNPINGDMSKLTIGNWFTGESQEVYFYT